MKQCERKVDSYVAYNDSLCSTHDWIRSLSDQLTANSDVTGDVLSVTARLQRVGELASQMPEGRAKVEACVNAAAIASEYLVSSSRQSVLVSVDELQKMWRQLEEDVNKVEQSLRDVVNQWTAFEEHCHTLDEWLKNVDQSVKHKVSMSNVDEIRLLVKSYQVSMS